MKKCVVFGVTADVTCGTHWATKYFLLKVIYTDQLFLLHKATMVSQRHFIIRKLFQELCRL